MNRKINAWEIIISISAAILFAFYLLSLNDLNTDRQIANSLFIGCIVGVIVKFGFSQFTKFKKTHTKRKEPKS